MESMSSLDIETTGLDHKKEWIWSMGITSGKKGRRTTTESFIKPKTKQAAEQLAQSASIFNIAGYHDAHAAAVKSGTATDVSAAMEKTFAGQSVGSVLLIQNKQFEDEAFGMANLGRDATSPDAKSNIAAKMMYPIASTHGAEGDNSVSLFRRPPSVETEVQKAKHAQSILTTRSSANTESNLGKVVSAHRKVMDQYRIEAALAASSGKMITMDLADITKAVYAEAAQSGHMSSSLITTGTSVDFLTKLLYNSAETHGAGDDSRDQLKIMDKMDRMYQELRTGKVSDDTSRTLRAAAASQPLEASRIFLSSLKNSLDELDIKTYTKRLGTSVLAETSSVNFNTGERYTHLKRTYPTESTIRTDKGALAAALGRSPKKQAGLNPGDYVSSLKDLSREDKLKKIDIDIDRFKSKITDSLAGTMNPIESLADRARGISKKTYRNVAIGALALMAFSGKSDSNKTSMRVKRDRSEGVSDRNNLDSALHSFSRPEIYHGTGFHMWDNAIGHHGY